MELQATGCLPGALCFESQLSNGKAKFDKSDISLGSSIALSADGDTLAVGARGESEGVTGVNGAPGNSTATG